MRSYLRKVRSCLRAADASINSQRYISSLGQFNATSIRVSPQPVKFTPNFSFNMVVKISFAGFVYPSLVLAYLGQGARLIENGPAILPNVFYASIPGPVNGPLYWYCFSSVLYTFRSELFVQDCIRIRHPRNCRSGQNKKTYRR